MPNIGPLELAIVLVVALLIFGPKKLPQLGRDLGSSMRGFKDSLGRNERSDSVAELPVGASEEASHEPARDEAASG
jgi:sec-independent protein translocase protein TatA